MVFLDSWSPACSVTPGPGYKGEGRGRWVEQMSVKMFWFIFSCVRECSTHRCYRTLVEVGRQLSGATSTLLFGANSIFLVAATPWACWPDRFWSSFLSSPAASLWETLGLWTQASISSFSLAFWVSQSSPQLVQPLLCPCVIAASLVLTHQEARKTISQKVAP